MKIKTHIALTLVLAAVSIAFAPSFLKVPITEGETDPVMLEIDPYMIDALYGQDEKGQTGRFGAEGGLADLLTEPKFVELIEKHDLDLFNGPMIGDIKPTSAKFWVRTAGAFKVQVKIGELVSEVVQTDADDDFTAVMKVEGLTPFTEHKYSVMLNDKVIERDSFHFRTAPRQGDEVKFHVTFGSGARYVPVTEYAWSNMAAARPLAYLGLGDNVYIDVMHRRGAQRLFYYRRAISPAYRQLINSVGMYAVWDDHDMAMDLSLIHI